MCKQKMTEQKGGMVFKAKNLLGIDFPEDVFCDVCRKTFNKNDKIVRIHRYYFTYGAELLVHDEQCWDYYDKYFVTKEALEDGKVEALADYELI